MGEVLDWMDSILICHRQWRVWSDVFCWPCKLFLPHRTQHKIGFVRARQVAGYDCCLHHELPWAPDRFLDPHWLASRPWCSRFHCRLFQAAMKVWEFYPIFGCIRGTNRFAVRAGSCTIWTCYFLDVCARQCMQCRSHAVIRYMCTMVSVSRFMQRLKIRTWISGLMKMPAFMSLDRILGFVLVAARPSLSCEFSLWSDTEIFSTWGTKVHKTG